MNVKTLCLGVLSAGEASGYEIKKEIEEGLFSHFIEASYGSIYPALTQLAGEGFVTVRAEEQSGKPDKKVYAITATGRTGAAANDGWSRRRLGPEERGCRQEGTECQRGGLNEGATRDHGPESGEGRGGGNNNNHNTVPTQTDPSRPRSAAVHKPCTPRGPWQGRVRHGVDPGGVVVMKTPLHQIGNATKVARVPGARDATRRCPPTTDSDRRALPPCSVQSTDNEP